jgi:hypothetical protein
MIPAVVPSSPSQSCLSADSDEGMEAELREEEMAQEEEKEVDMAAVETTTAAVQAAAVQQQQQSQPLSHQAETAAAAAAETPDEKAGVERTAGSGGKRAKESDEEVTSPSGEDEAKWVLYEQEVDAKRRKLSVAQKRRARKKAGRRAAGEATEREAQAAGTRSTLSPPSFGLSPELKERVAEGVAWLQSVAGTEVERLFQEQWTANVAAADLPAPFKQLLLGKPPSFSSTPS